MIKLKFGNGTATNSILLTLVQVVTTVLGLIVTKLLSVYFSLEEYGTYSQALLVTSTITSLSILGLTNATNYFYNRTQDEDQKKKYISAIFLIQYIIGVFCAFIVILFRNSISSYFGNHHLSDVLLIVACTPLLSNLISMYQVLFVSIGQAKKIAGRNFVVSSVRLIAVIFACFATKNITTVLVVIFLLDIVQVLYFTLMFKREKYLIKPRITDYEMIKEILSFSIPMAIFVLTNSLTRDIDKYIISAFSNTKTLAVYTNAAKILPFDILTASLITILIPIITRYINEKKYDDARKVFKLYLRLGYIITSIFVGGAIAVSKYLMLFLYDEKYMSGLPIFVVYLFIDIIRFANVTTILSGSGNTKILMRVSITALILNGIFNIVTYKILGIMGPAITTLVITVLMTLTLLFYGAKVIRTKIVCLFDLKEISIIVFEILLFGFATYCLSNILRNLGFNIFMVLLISYGAYLIIMFGLNIKKIISCFRELNQYK